MLPSRVIVPLLFGIVTFFSHVVGRRSTCESPGVSYGDDWPASCIDGYHQFGDGWFLVQQRVDETGNFYRGWTAYKYGFSNGDNVWVGLEVLHEQLSLGTHELAIEMVGEYGEYRFARYSSFAIGNETENYTLKELGQYSGTAGDSFLAHKGAAFSTFDRDNDQIAHQNCAVGLSSGWWFARNCLDRSAQTCNLNGRITEQGSKMYWRFRKGSDSLKYVRMMIRKVL